MKTAHEDRGTYEYAFLPRCRFQHPYLDTLPVYVEQFRSPAPTQELPYHLPTNGRSCGSHFRVRKVRRMACCVLLHELPESLERAIHQRRFRERRSLTELVLSWNFELMATLSQPTPFPAEQLFCRIHPACRQGSCHLFIPQLCQLECRIGFCRSRNPVSRDTFPGLFAKHSDPATLPSCSASVYRFQNDYWRPNWHRPFRCEVAISVRDVIEVDLSSCCMQMRLDARFPKMETVFFWQPTKRKPALSDNKSHWAAPQ